MRADRREALLGFLLDSVADGGITPFRVHVLAGLRRVVRCAQAAYFEWRPEELLEFSLAADEPASILQVWGAYPQVRNDDPLSGGPAPGQHESLLPDRDWLGRPLAISDVISDREFRRRGLYAEICKPLGVRDVMKVFLPTGGGARAGFLFGAAGRDRIPPGHPPPPPPPAPPPGHLPP